MSANKFPKNFRKIWFLFAVFLLPAIICLLFYYFIVRQPLIINARASLYKALPYYGSKIISDKGDTIYNTVKDANLIDVNGDNFSTESVKSKVLIVNFFSLQNSNNANKMAASLFRAQGKLKFFKNVMIISINLTPNSDSIKQVAEISKKVHAQPQIWKFFSSQNQNEIERWARVNFALRKGEIDSLSYSKLYLVDANRNIRGVYNGTKTNEVNTMLDEVKVLDALFRVKQNEQN